MDILEGIEWAVHSVRVFYNKMSYLRDDARVEGKQKEEEYCNWLFLEEIKSLEVH